MHKLWLTGGEETTLGLMILRMWFIRWWTWCNLL